MCTAISLQSSQGETFFGRTMDFSYDIQPQIYIVPSNYIWSSTDIKSQIHDRYSFIGIGQELDGILAFFDGVNEKGFAAASLFFAGYANYDVHQSSQSQDQTASFDFLHYILGRCASISDLEAVLKTVSIVGKEDPVTKTIAPLHWMAVDRSGKCAVIEQTEKGLEMFSNTLGVMANSPDFRWHITNLRNYMETSQKQLVEADWGSLQLKPFGQAGGTLPLPGGFTSPERFVRTAYLKTHIPVPNGPSEAIISCFHIMESVSIPRGAVVTGRDTYDYTKYTAFINTNTCEYFFKTYDNIQIGTASLLTNYKSFSQPISMGSITLPISL